MTPIDRGPIFIGGLSHSGKTELRLALGAHPDLELTRHTDLWGRFHGAFGDLGREENLDRCLTALAADDRVRDILQPDVDRIRRAFLDGDRSYARLFGLLHAHHAERAGKRRWGEQLGFVERYAAPIFDAFPNARMIHMIRDPRARWRTEAGSPRTPGGVGWETARWLRSAELANENRRRYDDRYLILRYEALVRDPIGTVRDVCAFLDERSERAIEEAIAGFGFGADDATGDPRDERARAVADAFVWRHALRGIPGFSAEPAASRMSAGARLSGLVREPVDRAAMAAWRLFDGRRSPRARAS